MIYATSDVFHRIVDVTLPRTNHKGFLFIGMHLLYSLGLQRATGSLLSFEAPFSSYSRELGGRMESLEFFPFDDLFATVSTKGASYSSMSSTSIDLAVNAWSVNSVDGDFAASLFAASLFPYLVLLYFLAAPSVQTPKGANFGFQFLLVFVFVTIPAGNTMRD